MGDEGLQEGAVVEPIWRPEHAFSRSGSSSQLERKGMMTRRRRLFVVRGVLVWRGACVLCVYSRT